MRNAQRRGLTMAACASDAGRLSKHDDHGRETFFASPSFAARTGKVRFAFRSLTAIIGKK